MTAELSVQVPVRNGGEGFLRFLQSLARQDLALPWELVVVDDGSETPVQTEYLEHFAALPDNCEVKVIRMDPGGNRPAARNAALEASGAPVALLMDADLSFDPHLLRRHLEIRGKTGADAVMGRRVNAWSPEASPWQKWMDTRAMGNSPPGPFPWNYFITGNLSVPVALLLEAGGFDTAIDRYGGEDTEMGYRLMEVGAVFHWDPSLRVDHLDHVTVRKHSMKMLEYGGTGLRYTLNKHPGTRGLLGSRWVEPVFSPPLYLAPVRMAVAVALASPVYRTALSIAERWGAFRPLFTYLSVGACLAGLKGKDLKL